MTEFPTVRVAAVQAMSVPLDLAASLDKATELIEKAAADGAQLAVLPECFLSLYPSGSWAAAAATWTSGCDELWERLWQSSVDVRGPEVDRLADVCRANDIHVVIGVNEREDDRPGSMWNSMLTIGPSGLLNRHRKLMPTMHERVFHGQGSGDDLAAVPVPGVGRVGGLICWENRMPLARWRVYETGPQIWAAPTADDSEAWLVSMRALAIEAGAFVVSVPQYITAAGFPADFPLPLPEGQAVLGRGGACVVAPSGEVIAGQLHDAEGIVVADCDLRQTLHAKRYFDVAGHYSRPDVLPFGG